MASKELRITVTDGDGEVFDTIRRTETGTWVTDHGNWCADYDVDFAGRPGATIVASLIETAVHWIEHRSDS